MKIFTEKPEKPTKTLESSRPARRSGRFGRGREQEEAGSVISTMERTLPKTKPDK